MEKPEARVLGTNGIVKDDENEWYGFDDAANDGCQEAVLFEDDGETRTFHNCQRMIPSLVHSPESSGIPTQTQNAHCQTHTHTIPLARYCINLAPATGPPPFPKEQCYHSSWARVKTQECSGT